MESHLGTHGILAMIALQCKNRKKLIAGKLFEKYWHIKRLDHCM
jgi:hypothetical protein